jgi:imidazole glycerol-phosphate synthase subunit HisH
LRIGPHAFEHKAQKRTLRIRKPAPLLLGTPAEPSVYFVHSNHAVAADQGDVAAESDYPEPFAAVVWRDNVTACQFHPEKGQTTGPAKYANFVAI